MSVPDMDTNSSGSFPSYSYVRIIIYTIYIAVFVCSMVIVS